MKKHFPHPPAQRQYGFSLMELSLVLVVIGLEILALLLLARRAAPGPLSRAR